MRRVIAAAAACLATVLAQPHAYAEASAPVFDTTYRVLSRTADSLERALARRSAVVDDNDAQLPVAASLSELFPQYGFSATPSFVSQSLHPLDEDRVRVCLSVQVSSIDQWSALVRLASNRGYARANASCLPQGTWATPLASYPAVAAAVFEHDRRRAPVPTRRTGEVHVENLPVRNVQAAYVLSDSPRTLALVNPAPAWEGTCSTAAQAPAAFQQALLDACLGVDEALRPLAPAAAGYWLRELGVSAGPGLAVPASGTCADLAPGQSCDYTVSRQTGYGKKVFAALRLQWQRVAVITVDGATLSLAPESTERVMVGFELAP